jgi:hypothetical protein
VSLLLCLASVAALVSCGPGRGSVQAPASPTVATVPTRLAPKATLTGASAASWSSLAGWWGMIDGGFFFEFREDGTCARHLESSEDSFFTTEGRCELVGVERLVIELRGGEATEYEWRLEEPWLMLRDAAGNVTRYRRQ